MANAKYEITDETTVTHNGRTLHRIRRLADHVLGGWIEKEENLSTSGEAWVFDEAQVFGKARVSGKARVFGEAQVFGKAQIFGEARVSGKALTKPIDRQA